MDTEYNKTCPNCGGIEGQGDRCELVNWQDDGWQVACFDCGIHELTHVLPSAEQAVFHWNSVHEINTAKNQTDEHIKNTTTHDIGW